MLGVVGGPARSRAQRWKRRAALAVRGDEAALHERLDRIDERLDRIEERLARSAREVELGQERLADQYAFLTARLLEVGEDLAAVRAGAQQRTTAP